MPFTASKSDVRPAAADLAYVKIPSCNYWGDAVAVFLCGTLFAFADREGG